MSTPTAPTTRTLVPTLLLGAACVARALGADAPPVAVADALTGVKDAKLVVAASALAANDTDPDGDPLLITAVSAATAQGGAVALVDGKVIYTPPAGFTGTDTFTYTVRDGARVSAPIPTGAPLGFGDAARTLTISHSGYGSSIAAVPGVPGEFYLLTDRGPNGDNSGVPAGSPALADPNAKTFPFPGFAPEIAHVRWNADGSVTRLGVIHLQDAAGKPLTGLPNHLNGTTVRVPVSDQVTDVGYDITGNPLAVDPDGIDSEGLVALPDGTFWVSDEYGPWLAHFDAAGRTIERIGPFAANAQGHKLPAVLAQRLTNKGMEGLTVTPSGALLVGMMQSALVNDPVNDPVGNPYAIGSANTYGKNSKKNLMTRLITYRLVAGGGEAVGTVHQYAYLLGDPAASGTGSGNKQAISEITALSETDILVDERDGNFPSDAGGSDKRSWVCHLPSGIAGDATPLDDAGDGATGLLVMVGSTPTTLETLVFNKAGAPATAALAGVGLVPLPKDAAPLVPLSQLGAAYTHDKVEGVVASGGKIVYSNDDDFGLNGSVVKIIPGSFPEGLFPRTAVGGLTTDYSQLLEVDAQKLLSATGTVTVTVGADTPPTISPVADQHVAENTAPAAIAVTVGDAETPAANLLLTAVSGNPALVPSTGIVVGGSGAGRTVTITPAAGRIGSATITLTVDDTLGMTTTTTFAVVVADTPPTLSAVADQVTTTGIATNAIAVTVGDAETAAASLVLSATSGNPTLVPPAAITLAGSGGARTVTVTPAAGQTGSAVITLTVADGQGLTASRAFTLTVFDHAPVAADGTLAVAPGATATGTLLATDSDGQALTYAAQTSPSKGSLTVTAATGAYSYTANAGASGTDTFTFTANDGVLGSNVATVAVIIGSGGATAGSSGGGSHHCGSGSGIAALLLAALAWMGAGLRRPRRG